MSEPTKLAEFADRASAEAIAELLHAEEIQAHVQSTRLLAGLESGFTVVVAPDDLERAQAVLAARPGVTDEELEELAVSSPGLDDDA